MWAGLPMAVPTPVPMRPDFSPAALSRSAGPELAASAPLPSAPAPVVAPVAAAAAVPAAPSAAPLPFVAAERPLPAASVSDPGGAAFDGRAPGGALDDDFAALHAHGFNDEDAWDIAAITAFFGLSNRMASFSNMLPNPEFYLMGRVPKTK